jgi:hypothetical protein
MPAINVARTDTFELQRQKINNIATQIFDISDGGSDLSTGNLKLGNGTKNVPSLAFTTDSTLGLYKPKVESVVNANDGTFFVPLPSFKLPVERSLPPSEMSKI